PPPPSARRFPYTRSSDLRRGDQLTDLTSAELLRLADVEVVDFGACLEVRALARGHGRLLDRLASLGAGRGDLEAQLDPLVGGLEDRKSTRLNSSHVSISY